MTLKSKAQEPRAGAVALMRTRFRVCVHTPSFILPPGKNVMFTSFSHLFGDGRPPTVHSWKYKVQVVFVRLRDWPQQVKAKAAIIASHVSARFIEVLL